MAGSGDVGDLMFVGCRTGALPWGLVRVAERVPRAKLGGAAEPFGSGALQGGSGVRFDANSCETDTGSVACRGETAAETTI